MERRPLTICAIGLGLVVFAIVPVAVVALANAMPVGGTSTAASGIPVRIDGVNVVPSPVACDVNSCHQS